MPTAKPPPKPTRCIFYARVSTDHQTDNTSIGDQLSRGKAFALSQGWALEQTFIESGESGKSTDRAAFREMVTYIRDTPPDILLCFKLDRLCRNLRDLLCFIDFELDPRNIALQSVTENFNTQSPEGRLFLQLLGSFAEFERKRINERTQAGKIATAKAGKWNGGCVPYAYRKIEGSDHDFEVMPQEADIVKALFALYATGKYGLRQVKDMACCPLSHIQIGNLLGSIFYTGRLAYDGHVQWNDHERIIGDRLFNRVQKVRAFRAKSQSVKIFKVIENKPQLAQIC